MKVSAFLISEVFLLLISGVLDFMEKGAHADGGVAWFCKICNYSSKFSTHVKAHATRLHIKSKNLPCKYCHKIFNNEYKLKYHITNHHQNLIMPKCI